MIESLFSYGKGYLRNFHSSNFKMTDASNLASIELLKLIPMDSVFHQGCFCIECASVIHAREAAFDKIKTEIEKCMVIAFNEGREFERTPDRKET